MTAAGADETAIRRVLSAEAGSFSRFAGYSLQRFCPLFLFVFFSSCLCRGRLVGCLEGGCLADRRLLSAEEKAICRLLSAMGLLCRSGIFENDRIAIVL